MRCLRSCKFTSTPSFDTLSSRYSVVHGHASWHVTIANVRFDMDFSTSHCLSAQRSAQFQFHPFELLSCFDIEAPWLGNARSGGSPPYLVSCFKHTPPGSYRAFFDFTCLTVPDRNKQCAPFEIAWPPLSWPNSAKLQWCQNGRNKVMETLRHACRTWVSVGLHDKPDFG